MIQGAFGWLTKTVGAVVAVNSTPPQQYNFRNKVHYDPIYGTPAKVDQPGILLKTNFLQVPPGIEHLSGRLDTHFVRSPLYQAAYLQHKASNFNEPHRFISQYFNGVIAHKQLTFMDGTHISSRDPYRKRRHHAAFGKIVNNKSKLNCHHLKDEQR
jgi:hypothetical protein